MSYRPPILELPPPMPLRLDKNGYLVEEWRVDKTGEYRYRNDRAMGKIVTDDKKKSLDEEIEELASYDPLREIKLRLAPQKQINWEEVDTSLLVGSLF